jgi:predicted nuclease of predicted toxin-antitoxin system
MKLLFDQNLSPKLARLLSDIFPGSAHVDRLGYGAASDEILWDYAKDNGFAFVTKDEDYRHLSLLHGTPPKILWLVIGNCTTSEVEELIRNHFPEIQDFEADQEAGVLELG